MFSSYSRPGFWYVTLIGISAQSGGNSWPTANPLNAPPQLSIPYVVPKQLWTLNEGCFDKEVSSFVYRRRTGLSKVTFLKVGWVKISKFLPRDLTQGELGKIEPTGVPGSLGWLWDWNFGSGPEISLCGLYTSHAYSEFFAFHKFFALQRGHRTPQLGTYTYCKIHALCKIFALHKIFVLGDFSVFAVFFFRFFFFSFFFFGENRLESRFLEYGQGSGFAWDVCSFTYYRIPGHFGQKWPPQKKRKKSSAGWNVIIFWYMMEKIGVGSIGKVEGGHAYCFIFAFQKISALQGWHRTLSVELFCTEENRIVDDLCSQILLCRALCGATKMSRNMGMALLMKGQPSVPEHKLTAYELGFEILKSVEDKFP